MPYNELQKQISSDLVFEFQKKKTVYSNILAFIVFTLISFFLPTVFPQYLPWIKYLPYAILFSGVLIIIAKKLSTTTSKSIHANYIRFSESQQILFFEQELKGINAAEISFSEIKSLIITKKDVSQTTLSKGSSRHHSSKKSTYHYLLSILLTDTSKIDLKLYKKENNAIQTKAKIEAFIADSLAAKAPAQSVKIKNDLAHLITTKNTLNYTWSLNGKQLFFRYFFFLIFIVLISYLIAKNVLPSLVENQFGIAIAFMVFVGLIFLIIIVVLVKSFAFAYLNKFKIQLAEHYFTYTAYNKITGKAKEIAHIHSNELTSFAFNVNGTNPTPDLNQVIYFKPNDTTSSTSKFAQINTFFKNQVLFFVGFDSIQLINLRNKLNEILKKNKLPIQ